MARFPVARLLCSLIVVLLATMRSAEASPLMTVRIHVSGDIHLDRLERYAADPSDTGCTLIRKYAPPGKPHAYSYTLTINEAGRHFHRDTLYLTVDPYHRGQTVYSGSRTGRVQLFTQQHGKAVDVTSLQGVAGMRFRVTLTPDLRSGTVQAGGMLATYGGRVGLRASMTASWSCPRLFTEHWGLARVAGENQTTRHAGLAA